MDYLLHIDTSSDTGTIAVAAEGKIVSLRINDEARNHAGSINLMIEDAVSEAGITLQQLCGIVVCAGPGSYTGLRIGMATAKGLCYALDIPLMLDSRLSLLAHQAYVHHPAYDKYISLITAREKEYFITIYDHKFVCELAPQHMAEAEVTELLQSEQKKYMITDAPESFVYCLKVNNLHADNNIKIDVNCWAEYASRKYKCNDIVNLAAAEPFYLKQVYTHK